MSTDITRRKTVSRKEHKQIEKKIDVVDQKNRSNTKSIKPIKPIELTNKSNSISNTKPIKQNKSIKSNSKSNNKQKKDVLICTELCECVQRGDTFYKINRSDEESREVYLEQIGRA